jgi:hypothetical protein
MSLTNIKLPGFVIADLYRNTLIQPEGPLPSQEVQAAAMTEPAPIVSAEPEPRVAAEPKPVVKAPVPEHVIERSPSKPAGQPAYKVLGNNKKQISVVVNCPNDVFVPEADLQFLTKMLGACKLNMADVAIVNHATAAVHIDRLKIQLQPKYLLLFGVEPDVIHLPINFPSFKEQPYAGTTFLYTPGLSELNLETDQAKVLKRKLWDCLKRMFL